MDTSLRLFVWLLAGFAAAAAGLALHFRAHAVRMAGERDGERLRRDEAQRRVADVAEDLARSAAIIGDNLAEISLDSGSERSRLYLEGARAHCQRLGEMALRLRRVASRDESPAP